MIQNLRDRLFAIDGLRDMLCVRISMGSASTSARVVVALIKASINHFHCV